MTDTKPARSWLSIWLSRHAAAAASSIARLLRRPLASLFTLSAMALTLSLPLGLWLALVHLDEVSGGVDAARNIDLFLTPGLSAGQAEALAAQLRTLEGIAGVEVQTPEQGLHELRARPGWGDVSTLLGDENPLPYRLRVRPTGEPAPLLAPLHALPGVDLVQYDAIWRQRLDDWLHLGRRLLWLLGALFGLGALLVVGNTVRLEMHARREDMQILSLLGASHGEIRRPFLYLGACYGVLAAAFAIAILSAAVASLGAPLAELADSYHSHFVLHGFAAVEIVLIVAAGSALGWLGAVLVGGWILRKNRV